MLQWTKSELDLLLGRFENASRSYDWYVCPQRLEKELGQKVKVEGRNEFLLNLSTNTNSARRRFATVGTRARQQFSLPHQEHRISTMSCASL